MECRSLSYQQTFLPSAGYGTGAGLQALHQVVVIDPAVGELGIVRKRGGTFQLQGSSARAMSAGGKNRAVAASIMDQVLSARKGSPALRGHFATMCKNTVACRASPSADPFAGKRFAKNLIVRRAAHDMRP